MGVVLVSDRVLRTVADGAGTGRTTNPAWIAERESPLIRSFSLLSGTPACRGSSAPSTTRASRRTGRLRMVAPRANVVRPGSEGAPRMGVNARPRVVVNEVPSLNVSMDEAVTMIERAARERNPRCVFFVNADCINITTRDPGYRRLLARDDAWVFGDGVGVRIAGAISRQRVVDNVNGTDMFPLLAARCAGNGQAIFLLGGREGVARRVAQRMTARYPGLRIAGTHHGFFAPDACSAVIDQVNASGADIVLLALGAPLQERFIAAHREALRPPVLVGVGGLFDFYSGRIRRAPKLVRDLSLEWAWRLAVEPRRLWKRYLLGNVAFLAQVLWWELQHAARGARPEPHRRLVPLHRGTHRGPAGRPAAGRGAAGRPAAGRGAAAGGRRAGR